MLSQLLIPSGLFNHNVVLWDLQFKATRYVKFQFQEPPQRETNYPLPHQNNSHQERSISLNLKAVGILEITMHKDLADQEINFKRS